MASSSDSSGNSSNRVLLKLYITGQTPRSERAVANLRRICDERLGEGYQLTIVDVLERPELAEQDRILATPTLVRQLPPPVRRIIGDLSDVEKVVAGLNLDDCWDMGGSGGRAR